jgi:hypothetical protein
MIPLDSSYFVTTWTLFLWRMKVIRNERRVILYFSEIWLFQNRTLPECWQKSEGNSDLIVPTVEGGQMGCGMWDQSAQTGFIDGYKLVFRSMQKSANTDYHGDVNAEVFRTCFMKLLDTLHRYQNKKCGNHNGQQKLSLFLVKLQPQAQENVKLFTGYRRATFAMIQVTP